MLMYDDVKNLAARVTIQEVLGLARPLYRLRELCTVVQMPRLTARVRTATDYTGSEKVPELHEADIKCQAYSYTDFALWKNVVHLALSKEAELKTDVDVLALEVKSAARELARMENSQIATEIEADGTSAGTSYDWSEKTNGVSNHDPITDILNACEPIHVAGYMAKVIAFNWQQYADLVANTHISSLLERGTIVKSGKLPAIVGLQIITDENITDNYAYVCDPDAPWVILGEGPELAVKYGQDSPKFFEGYAIAKFIEPEITIAGGGRVLNCSS
jgi:hypothetical protein